MEYVPGEDAIISKEILISVINLSREGKFLSFREVDIDLRREHSYASIRLLETDAILHFSKQDLVEMRNEIFAAHGFKFKNPNWRDFFSKKDWYIAEFDDVNHLLTPIEQKTLS